MSGMHRPACAKISFATAPSTLGTVLVARQSAGVCALLLGESAEALEGELRKIFPQQSIDRDEHVLEGDLAAAVEVAERPWLRFAPPLAVEGTPFQRRVWSALRDIPAGTTVSYAEIARRIGAPSALRAVAGACAANVLAIAIPCHRVLRRNGTLSGYRWGLERKRALIERERTRRSPHCDIM